MAKGNRLSCDKCGFKAETSGPWEFKWGENGEMRGISQFSHEQAEGIYVEAYCPKCRLTVKAITENLRNPERLPPSWSIIRAEYVGPIRCPHCDSETIYNRPRQCPQCGKNKLRVENGGRI